ncbi:MAG: hypothetical protein DMG72_22025 [Acidobacteria bacterium]|nr:MAG: hypothetical protein DMG72_22025 [Acidobacteriota bacterium]
MKRSLLSASLAFAVALGSIGIVPLAKAAAGDSFVFNMVKSAGAVPCLNATAFGRVTISDLGPVQNMHVEVFKLPANTEFTLFVITTPNAPFVPAWYQGDLTTNAVGRGILDVTGIFSDETFILNPGVPAVPVETHHLGLWFADPADAVNAGCPGTVTPFDGDHNAGIQVLNTSNFAIANGPLGRIQ